jgi:ribosome-associated protein
MSSPVNPDPKNANESQVQASLKMAMAAARVAAENRGQDIVVLDVSKQTSLFDCFLIVTGTSRRQLHAIAEDINRLMKEEFGEKKLSISGYSESRWIVVDYGGLVVHLFDEEARGFYDLEGLWGDGSRVDLTEALRNTGASMTPLED